MYACLSLGGDDRSSFLQGQLTQDIASLDGAVSLPAAWCNAKGRVVVTCRLLAGGNTIGVVVPSPVADAVANRLSLYRLRASVSIERWPDFRALAFAGESAKPVLRDAGLEPPNDGTRCRMTDGIIVAAYPAAELFVELFGSVADLAAIGLDGSNALDDASWRGARIAAGLVDIAGDNAEQYTPHMLNLDRTGAVSFDKGCYTGQEVVARTEHLGRVKRRINRYRLEGAAASVGDKLRFDGKEVGEVVNAGETEILAVTPVAKRAETLDINAGRAVPLPLPYSLA